MTAVTAVTAVGAGQPLRCVLVANRGEIARRVVRTARRMGMRTVAVFSDADAGAAFVAEADLAVRLPGSTPAETYLRADLVVDAARRAGADCVHPGYGFLSENAEFARAVADAGLVFVGPSPKAIEAMGSKLAAKALMREAGVPTLPSVDATGLTGQALADAGEQVGYPLLVKASYGGGGRGMRTVREPGELAEAVTGAQREAASAFGDGTVFLERLVERPRHVEVQIFGDTHGHFVALHERECSIQRRHQKVIEEAPSPAVDAELRSRLAAAAVAAARTLDYTGAGTVEFLLAPDGAFYFLEVNTRLQVEHPVTEAVTGLDLVQLQLDVAAGRPLPPEALDPPLVGHAVEARLYAEDPARGWLPQAGRVHLFDLPATAAFGGVGKDAGPGVRLDAALDTAADVGVHYDPMLAKVIAWAPDRTQASLLLADALARARVHGLTTNRDLLVRVLRHPGFLAGETDTAFLDRHGLDTLAAPLLDEAGMRLHLLAAALAQQAVRRADAPVWGGLPSGWRNNPTDPQTAVYDTESDEPVRVRYRLDRTGLHARVGNVDLTGRAPDSVVSRRDDGSREVALTLEVDDGRGPLRLQVQAVVVPPVGTEPVRVFVASALGSCDLVEQPRFPDPSTLAPPGSLTAAMPGTVARVLVSAGDRVSEGQLLLVLEAMKMEHPVTAPEAGTVTELPVEVGSQVETGAVLAVVTDGAG